MIIINVNTYSIRSNTHSMKCVEKKRQRWKQKALLFAIDRQLRHMLTKQVLHLVLNAAVTYKRRSPHSSLTASHVRGEETKEWWWMFDGAIQRKALIPFSPKLYFGRLSHLMQVSQKCTAITSATTDRNLHALDLMIVWSTTVQGQRMPVSSLTSNIFMI